jgi:hypothetical protein
MSVTTEPGELPGEETVRVDGEFAGRIRRMSSGTYRGAQGQLVVADGADRSEAIGAVVREFRAAGRYEAEQARLDAAVSRDRESYRRAVEDGEEA